MVQAMDCKREIFTYTMGTCNFLYLVLNIFFLGCNAQSDIDCLKSFKNSLEDPYNYLSSTWNFDHQTEGFICKFRGVECWEPNKNKVISIQLPDMGLKGEFPRGLQNCSGLTSLDLSNNDLYGTIPWDISKILGYIVDLDLSNNQFSGTIPVNLANCSNLYSLKLDYNNLEGPIPPEIDSEFHRLRTFSFSNNSGLCGGPQLEACKIDNHRTLFICGFVTGWSLFTLLGICLFFFGFSCLRRIQLLLIKKRTKAQGIEPDKDPKISKLEKIVTRMSFRELANATSNFSQDHEIGQGMLGKVYKGQVLNGWTFAIKRLHGSENLEDEFVSEITALGSVRHQNLVPLIGFCSDRDERLLVYKYMPNGNLHDWLHSTDEKARFLDFPLRVKIVVGVAKALAFLHHGEYFHVVHSNISTQCILLDKNFDPKISNFWEATLAKPTVDESFGFTSCKKDIYGFGVVLLELLTRKESYQLNCLTLNLCSSCFASQLEVDKVLLGHGFDATISRLIELAGNCMKFIPDQRPTMQQVYQTVAEIARSHDHTGDPEIQLQVD